MFRLVIFVTLLTAICGYSYFQEKIPNGDFIPHPCKPNFVWKGVGHQNWAGGGPRNQFGKDFLAAGKKWTEELCRKDSDADGKTNGQELGDPNCIWRPGTIPEGTVTGISHPGVCDPWGSPQCMDKNDWVSCEGDEFNCPAIHEEGVMTKELIYPRTNVPAKDTTYVCMGFELPSDGDYHIIATTPIINESRVMHHIGLIACGDDFEVTDTPRECSMGLRGCSALIGLWTLGLPGECFYKEAGIRMGMNGMKRGVLQFHWTNPEMRDDYWDSSGLKIYYTNKLRNYDAGTLMTGQQYLEMPPLSPKIVQQSTCSPRCTKYKFTDTIYITTGLNHMHYLGISQHVKLTRANGTEIMLTHDEHYSYDTPVKHKYDSPVPVYPGDSFETVCTYRSLSRKETAFFGEGTFDEMCFGIFNFYPAQNIRGSRNCVTINDFEMCDFKERHCDFRALYNHSNPETRDLIDKVLDVCSYDGHCRHGCRAVVDDVMRNHECFKDGAAEATTFSRMIQADKDTAESLKFVTAMKSCKCDVESSIEYKPVIKDQLLKENEQKVEVDGSNPQEKPTSSGRQLLFSMYVLSLMLSVAMTGL
ncbi:hypothetical protein LOTGIDRAFT_233457 [Lottia gigantea]|uniref:DOMON domain-containing protein n=1 Tax=Lottia gigantea TaxID=225164 RepID=V4AEC5_LOTGI|nr:hypothetical protein LOTGIDRAFT_233457 [Lottia gigantea]ESO91706.1 hypothetical protein LOTGIDRAFT_233457 [Lottia gigantea]